MSSEVVGRRETIKRYIRTVIENLPTFIENYNPPDKQILTDFLTVLNHFEEADYDRLLLSQRFEGFNHKYYQSKEYRKLPFLWFAVDYFGNANRILNITDFHAEDFYQYLVTYLRNNPDIVGSFTLIRENTSLGDSQWEKLQYACNQIPPLKKNELQALQTVYVLIEEKNLGGLNHNLIKTTIADTSSSQFSKKLNSYFASMEALWFFNFYPPAFGLEPFVFHFQLSESTSLPEIINFQDSTNYILCISDVFRINDFPNTFIGILYVPTPLVHYLHTYLQNFKNQRKVILHELSQLINIRMSASFALYRAEKGWLEFSTKIRRSLEPLKTMKPKRRRNVLLNPFYFSPGFSSLWNYLKYPDPIQIINIFCKNRGFYSYKELPFGSTTRRVKKQFSKQEFSVIKELHRFQVVNVGFFCQRLILNFSPDQYWIKLPLIPLNQLLRLLEWLPYTHIYFTKTNIHIWAYLTSKISEWLRTDLKWEVMPIILNHIPLTLKISWFDENSLQWKTPHILKM